MWIGSRGRAVLVAWSLAACSAPSVAPDQPGMPDGGMPPDGGPPVDGPVDAPDAPVESREPVVLAAHQVAPTGIAVDATHVYWTTGDGYVRKVAIGGGEPVVLAEGQASPRGIVVDATHAYWVNAVALGQVMAVPLAGGEPVALAERQRRPIQLAIGGGRLYWTNNAAGTVMSLPVTGGEPALVAERQATPVAIAVDADAVYWSSFGQGAIRAKALAGDPEIRTLASDQDAAALFVVDATVYWANAELEDGVSHVFRLVPGRPPEPLATGDVPVAAVADRRFVYWTDEYRNAVMQTPVAGGDSTVFAPDQLGAGALAIDRANVYWVDAADDGAVMKRAK